MLSFSSDKKTYNVGEKVKVNFPSAKDGRALVSIESGSKIIQAYWVKTEKDETNFDFKVTEEMTPNVYINITLVQPHLYTANDLPIRLYGVIPIMVENPNTKIQPVLNMPKILAPEENFTIQVNRRHRHHLALLDFLLEQRAVDHHRTDARVQHRHQVQRLHHFRAVLAG